MECLPTWPGCLGCWDSDRRPTRHARAGLDILSLRASNRNNPAYASLAPFVASCHLTSISSVPT